MGWIDLRTFKVATRFERSGELVVDGAVRLLKEEEADADLPEAVRVNALAVPASRPVVYSVMQHELRIVLSYLDDHPGEPLALRQDEFKASALHIKSLVSESFGLGMLSTAVQQHYGWRSNHRDLENFDALPTRLKPQYEKAGTRPDLLFFLQGAAIRRLAGEARGRSSKRPVKHPDRQQKSRLAEIVAWSGRNKCHPVTMTWAYSGAERVQVDLFDIRPPAGTTSTPPRPEAPSGPAQADQIQSDRNRAVAGAAELEDRLFATAPRPTRGRERGAFGRAVRGEWVTADLVRPSNLRFFLGVLDRQLEPPQLGAYRRQRGAASRDRDWLQVAVGRRLLVVVARDTDREPEWTEVADRLGPEVGGDDTDR